MEPVSPSGEVFLMCSKEYGRQRGRKERALLYRRIPASIERVVKLITAIIIDSDEARQ
jgi:hypothetical protein